MFERSKNDNIINLLNLINLTKQLFRFSVKNVNFANLKFFRIPFYKTLNFAII